MGDEACQACFALFFTAMFEEKCTSQEGLASALSQCFSKSTTVRS